MGFLSKLKILYVEDEDLIRESLAKFLSRRVDYVYTAKDGVEGVEAFNKHKPDIVITDIRMPNMDGLDMIERIKAIRDVPVVITTGHNDEKFFLRAIDAGIDKYLIKPINNQVLLETLEKIGRDLFREKEIEESNMFVKAILDISPQLMLVIENGDISYVNRSFLSFLGYSNLEELKKDGKTIDDFLVVKDKEFYKNKIFVDWMNEIIIHPDLDYIVHMRGCADAEEDVSTFLVQLSQIPHTDRYLMSFSDITLVEIIKLLYRELAVKDPLTRVFNRRKFIDELEAEISRSSRYNRVFSLVMFDIDHFKEVNDNYGHQIGDYVILEIVKITRDNIRRHDTIGRYGGEEFMVLLPETGLQKALEIAERLRIRIEQYSFKEAGQLTCSFGVVSYSDNENIDRLIKRVDDSLYMAKNNGRNRVESMG